jgi:hypothetical protein
MSSLVEQIEKQKQCEKKIEQKQRTNCKELKTY